MTPLALLLILISAGLHASWNLLAKRAKGGAAFVWLAAFWAALLYAPLAIVYSLWQRPSLSGWQLLFVAGTIVLHIGYFVSLQRGYQHGDLSLVYPLARGSGPLLATLGAVILLGERPSWLAVMGLLLIAGNVFLLTGGLNSTAGHWAVRYGLLTGLFIAAYTLWDKVAVSTLLIPPLLYDWASNVGRSILLAPLALRRRQEVRALWRSHRREVLGVAVLSPLSYLLILFVMTSTPVHYVAPAREISILMAALLGAGALAEGDAKRRLLGAGGMVLGVLALALG
jgi:drug/metabolite transporter (DMT)-like permease